MLIFQVKSKKDTLNIGIMSVGEVVNYPRTIRFEQVTKEWEYIYDTEDPNKVVDSVYVDMKFPAKEEYILKLLVGKITS